MNLKFGQKGTCFSNSIDKVDSSTVHVNDIAFQLSMKFSSFASVVLSFFIQFKLNLNKKFTCYLTAASLQCIFPFLWEQFRWITQKDKIPKLHRGVETENNVEGTWQMTNALEVEITALDQIPSLYPCKVAG